MQSSGSELPGTCCTWEVVWDQLKVWDLGKTCLTTEMASSRHPSVLCGREGGSRIDKPVVTFKLWEEVTARGTTRPAHHAEGLVLLLGKWLLPPPCLLME